jgi:Phage integrase, N-terminal SAM-like domain
VLPTSRQGCRLLAQRNSKKASTAATVKGHINNSLIPAFGKLAMGDLDSERVQSFLNRQVGKTSPKTVKNLWTMLRIMWNSAVAWKYATGGLRVIRWPQQWILRESLNRFVDSVWDRTGNGVTDNYTHTSAPERPPQVEGSCAAKCIVK